jgi:hypothetical protein
MTQKHVLLLPVTLIAKEGLSSTEMVSGCLDSPGGMNMI